jgi:hypothetical protein
VRADWTAMIKRERILSCRTVVGKTSLVFSSTGSAVSEESSTLGLIDELAPLPGLPTCIPHMLYGCVLHDTHSSDGPFCLSSDVGFS